MDAVVVKGRPAETPASKVSESGDHLWGSVVPV